MSDDFDLAVQAGLIVTPRGRAPLDIYVRDGRIAALEARSRRHRAASQIDAQGLLVLPGMVDTHVHLMEPGDESREDFPSGTAAAVSNGVTTIIEHTHGWPVTSTIRLAEKREALRRRSYARLRPGRPRVAGPAGAASRPLAGRRRLLQVMLDAALTGRTSLERVAEAYAPAPAKRYRLTGKGRIAPRRRC